MHSSADKLPLNHNLIVRLDKVSIAKKTEMSVFITHSVMWLVLGLRGWAWKQEVISKCGRRYTWKRVMGIQEQWLAPSDPSHPPIIDVYIH